MSSHQPSTELGYQEFLCFRLNAIARRIARAHNRACSEAGITGGQSFVLFDLLDHEGDNITGIANRLQLDSPAVGGYIDRLIKSDLVIRIEDPSDRRLYRIHLTNKGRKMAKDLLPKTRAVHDNISALMGSNTSTFESCLSTLEDKL